MLASHGNVKSDPMRAYVWLMRSVLFVFDCSVSASEVRDSNSLPFLEVLEDIEVSIVIILEDFPALPVSRDDLACSLVEQGGHLVGKEVPHRRVRAASDRFLFNVEEVGIAQELARESSKNYDLGLIDLTDTAALSLWEADGFNVDQLPGLAGLIVVLFDRVAVLLAVVRDSAEDVHKSVCKSAACMVVPSHVEGRHIVPKIKINVVLLTLAEGFVLVDAGACHNQELVLKDADGMTVAAVLELVLRDAVEHLFTVVNDLVAALERGSVASDVASSDQEQSVGLSLHILEVVLELVRDVDSALNQGLLCDVVGVHHF